MRTILLAAALAVLRSEEIPITLLATTDLHGNIFPYDYFTARPADRGLAKLASLIRAVRAENPNTLLVDCGDTIQGTPLEAVYQYFVSHRRFPLSLPAPAIPLASDPMMLAMNHLGFDAMAVGNHEYNYGLENLAQARAAARFPWLSANTVVAAGARITPFQPFLVKTIGGVKIAVIGITTPAIPLWEIPENYAGCRFTSGVEAARRAVAELRKSHQPDLIVVAAHAGLDRDLETGRMFSSNMEGENMIYQIATGVDGVDAIIYGHTHQQLAGHRVGKVLLAQPKNWGTSLARLDFVFDTAAGGRSRLVRSSSRLLPVEAGTKADEEVLALARPYHEITERYLATPIAQSPAVLDTSLSRVEDTALMDAIHTVQMHYAAADVSLTASFNPRARFPKGPVTVREIAALYIYDNDLYAIRGTGRMLRDALENAARYFRTCGDPACLTGVLINPDFLGFNYDMAQGVEYEIDLTQPEGRRVRNLRWRGKPLAEDQPLRIALNSYRVAGAAGYTMFRDAPVAWRSAAGIRELVIEYYTKRKTLPAAADHNWRIVPEAAAKRLREEAR